MVYLAGCALAGSPEFYADRGEQGADISFATAESSSAFQIFLGYILSDTLCVLWYRTLWPGSLATLIHHSTALFAWGQMLGGEPRPTTLNMIDFALKMKGLFTLKVKGILTAK